jgi:hypothetical protein
MTCSRCNSKRTASFSAKSSDLNCVRIGELEHEGYVPGDLGIGSGDYVEFDYCLDCGQMQGTFPMPKTEMETGNAEIEFNEDKYHEED